ncbi:hypothetical protein MH117_19615 [Paenibacillus sp. ACRRX]|nr:hypothetical protein [Paenibacillus sp. UMB4589-SE434]MCG7409617.1 hypothetical protein [Paenibacillus sp. ACRRX]
MLYIMIYVTPIVAVIFFINGVALAKKIKNGDENTASHTGWGAAMLGFIIYMLIWSNFLTQ